MFLWFFAIAVPLLLVGFALAVDVSGMINTNRSIRLAAESASVAGSFQFEKNGSGYLDPTQAALKAAETFQHAIDVGAVPNASEIVGSPQIQYQNISGVNRAVGVRFNVSYKMKNFVILRYFYEASGSVPSVALYEQARICRTYSSVSGFCGRPDTNAPAYQYGGSDSRYNWGSNKYSGHYPSHYPPHYPGHYPGHYPSHYPIHYAGHYPGHYPVHYASFQNKR